MLTTIPPNWQVPAAVPSYAAGFAGQPRFNNERVMLNNRHCTLGRDGVPRYFDDWTGKTISARDLPCTHRPRCFTEGAHEYLCAQDDRDCQIRNELLAAQGQLPDTTSRAYNPLAAATCNSFAAPGVFGAFPGVVGGFPTTAFPGGAIPPAAFIAQQQAIRRLSRGPSRRASRSRYPSFAAAYGPSYSPSYAAAYVGGQGFRRPSLRALDAVYPQSFGQGFGAAAPSSLYYPGPLSFV